jgi:hypothetical protein
MPKLRGEVAIDLDYFQVLRFFEQQPGEGALPWPDLHHEIRRLERQGIDDLFQDPRVVEEVLAEPLTRPVRARRLG